MFSSVQCCAGSCTQGRHLLGPWTPPTTLQCTLHCTVHWLHLTLHHPFTRIVGWAVGCLIENDALQETLIITVLSLLIVTYLYIFFWIFYISLDHIYTFCWASNLVSTLTEYWVCRQQEWGVELAWGTSCNLVQCHHPKYQDPFSLWGFHSEIHWTQAPSSVERNVLPVGLPTMPG